MPLPASVRHTFHRVLPVTADEEPPQTKSEGSDVSAAMDQLTEDKHGRRLGLGFFTAGKILGARV